MPLPQLKPSEQTQQNFQDVKQREIGAASLPPTNLPALLTPLIGREAELATLIELLCRRELRLLTLTGPGGTGKTRLSVQVATKLVEHFPDGVCFVSLAPVRDPALLIATIAHSLGMMESGDRLLLETLKSYLHDKTLLLVLDNFEHLQPAAPFVATLLATAPNLKILVTSRIVLHLAGEYDFRVLPLALPTLAHLPPSATLIENAAVALFIQRAQVVRPHLHLNDENNVAIAEICCRLDGLPLAIELAAARCKILSPQALLARLASPLQLLTTGAADLPSRQQTLRATIDWSYQLLSADEQTLFRRLAVFVGGWRLEAAEEICMSQGQSFLPNPVSNKLSSAALAVLDQLTVLVEHSLVLQQEESDGEPRFTMLETIREYALEQLEFNGELPLLRQLHVDYYLAFAEDAEPKLTGREQVRLLAKLDREHDNLRAALQACQNPAREATLGLRLAAALWWFWWVRGHVSEGRNWVENLLRQNSAPMPTQSFAQIRATALYRAAFLALIQDDYRHAKSLSEESMSLFRTLNDARGIAWATYTLGYNALINGDRQQATLYYNDCLTLFRTFNDSRGILWTLNDLGNLAQINGDLDRALLLMQERLLLARALGNLREIATSLGGLCSIAQVQGDVATATTNWQEALALFQSIGDRLGIAITLHSLAYLAELQPDQERGEKLYTEGLQIYQQIGNRSGIARCLVGLAVFATINGHWWRAARLLGAAAAQHNNLASFLSFAEQSHYEQNRFAIHTHLGDTAFNVAFAKGRSLTPAQALVLEDAPTSPSIKITSTTPPLSIPPPLAMPVAPTPAASTNLLVGGLSERETEVLRLLARGLSYAEIADQLIISPRTVNRHLTSIYTKLNVASRHAATRFALDNGLQ